MILKGYITSRAFKNFLIIFQHFFHFNKIFLILRIHLQSVTLLTVTISVSLVKGLRSAYVITAVGVIQRFKVKPTEDKTSLLSFFGLCELCM